MLDELDDTLIDSELEELEIEALSEELEDETDTDSELLELETLALSELEELLTDVL